MKYFVIKKIVKAETREEALRLEKFAPVSDCWEDDKQIDSVTEEMGNVGFI